MAFRIEADFNEQSIRRTLDQWTGKVENAIIQRLRYVGERFVQRARDNNTYKDQTGNLRSSIGYVVARRGEIVHKSFKKANAGTNGATGVNKAQELAQNIADDYPNDFVLICVAGMDYAATVETRGYDVITMSSLAAKQDLQSAVTALGKKLGRL